MSTALDTPARAAPVRAGDLPENLFMVEKLVRFGHCDPAAIVFFARWFELVNEVLEDWFSGALGLDYHAFIRSGTGLGPARVETDYFLPGRMGDRIAFRVALERIGTSSFAIRVHGHRGETELVRVRQVIVTTALGANRAIGLPETLRAALTAYEGRSR